MDSRHYTAIATLALFVIIGGLLLVAFGLPRTPGVLPELYFTNLAKWRTSGPHSYEITVQTLCECDTRPVRIAVVNGRVTSATVKGPEGAIPLPDLEHRHRPLTIDVLFEAIAASYRRGDHKVRVSYDPILGYPLEFFDDPSPNIIDDEVQFRVSDFHSGSGG